LLFIAFFALLLVVFEYFGLLSSRTPATPKVPPVLWIGVLILAYAAQLGIVWYAARHQLSADAWRAVMPLPTVDDRGLEIEHADAVSGAMLALAALESYALLALYRARVSTALVWSGCVLMIVLSLVSPALLSFDLYGYVHDALLGRAAYQPPAVPFAGEYVIFDRWFGGPSPTLYGPLWLVLIAVVTSAGGTLIAKMFAWRVFSALVFVALIFALQAYGVPSRVRVVTALNPGLLLQFVSNGHNDLVAIVLLVLAAAFVRARSAPLGVALIGVAGLIKLPYAVLGLPLLAAIGSKWVRFVTAIALLAAVVALSLLGGGTAYFSTLLGHVGSRPEDVTHRVAGVVALALIAQAFAGGRRLRSAAWIFPTMASSIFAWYYAWGVPYALARRRILGYVLVLFPFVTALFESALERTWELVVVLPIVALIAVFAPERAAAPAKAPVAA
jgi:hypothetical protein